MVIGEILGLISLIISVASTSYGIADGVKKGEEMDEQQDKATKNGELQKGEAEHGAKMKVAQLTNDAGREWMKLKGAKTKNSAVTTELAASSRKHDKPAARPLGRPTLVGHA